MQNFLPKVFVWVLIKSFRYRIATKTQRHPLRYCYSTFWLENVYGFKMIQEYTQTYTKIEIHYILFIDVFIELSNQKIGSYFITRSWWAVRDEIVWTSCSPFNWKTTVCLGILVLGDPSWNVVSMINLSSTSFVQNEAFLFFSNCS